MRRICLPLSSATAPCPEEGSTGAGEMQERGQKNEQERNTGGSGHMRFSGRKRKPGGTGLAILVILAAAVVLALAFCVHYLLELRRISTYTDVEVDGTVTAATSGDAEELLNRFREASPAEAVTGDGASAEKTSVAVVFSGLNDDVTVNEEILEALQEQSAQASFAIPAIGARENQGMVQKILLSGNSILSGGLDGTESDSQEIQELCGSLLKSRELLSEETGEDVTVLYCPGMGARLTSFKAAAAAGYQKEVVADDDDLIGADKFASGNDAEQYVRGIRGQHILVVRLGGEEEPVHQEPMVVAAKPAIDKQPDLDDEKTADSGEKISISEVTRWLLTALREQNVEIVPLSEIRTQEPEALIDEALTEGTGQAVVYRSVLTDETVAALCIRNLESAEQYEALKALLKEHSASASFFVTADTDPALLGEILKDGYSLENAGRTGRSYADAKQMYEEIESERSRLQDLGTESRAYLVQDESCLPAIRSACFVNGQTPVLPQNPEQLSEGAFYLFDASDLRDIGALLKEADQKDFQILDMRAALLKHGTIPALSAEETARLRKENRGEKSVCLQSVRTTERALGLTFGGLGNEAVDLDVAGILRNAGGAGTFFVTFDEMRENASAIEKLIGMGEEIGLLFRPSGSFTADFDGTSSYLHACMTYMEWRYSYTPKVILLPGEPAEEGVLEAVHAYGLTAVGASVRLMQDGTQNMTEEEVPAVLSSLHDAHVRFTRGGLEYFSLDYYEGDAGRRAGDQTIMGSMVSGAIREFVDSIAFTSAQTGAIEDGSRYSLKTVSDLLASDKVYTIRSTAQSDVTSTKNVLTSMESPEQQFAYIRDRYIGSNFIINKAKMPGFSGREIRQLDKKGKLTRDKVLFLTFDDWGTDESINKLLYVLDKYGVKATFFVLTEHVEANPNLLRSIAEAGHEIASHTNSHEPLADANENFTRYSSLTAEEQEAERRDLVTSYEKLNQYVGDISVDGKRALSLDFRPPTLEVSKEGLYQVFDVGFQYSVSGDVSTNDYEKTDLNKFIQSMMHGSPSSEDGYKVGSGSIIVMHMTESAKCTAQMLDTMIPYWQQQGYAFARIDDYIDRFEP